MARRLKQTVYVTDAKGQAHVFTAESTLPEWAAKIVTNPAAFEDDTSDDAAGADDPTPEPEPTPTPEPEPTPTPEPEPTPEPTPEPEPDEDEDEDEAPAGPPAPPKSGKGSGIKAWTEYAERIGVTIPDGADRDAIIAAVEATLED
ncbi:MULTISPECIES: hypothetical protein [unclassified Aeromicrobium]|uniref:hypothetical protein n=1 Tax=unclassified Aeromicrobium TaxID=2633570 RepID=UPI002888FBF4|nr:MULTISPECIES: hypothetical protein [unclassified Aeromicrobium]